MQMHWFHSGAGHLHGVWNSPRGQVRRSCTVCPTHAWKPQLAHWQQLAAPLQLPHLPPYLCFILTLIGLDQDNYYSLSHTLSCRFEERWGLLWASFGLCITSSLQFGYQWSVMSWVPLCCSSPYLSTTPTYICMLFIDKEEAEVCCWNSPMKDDDITQ